MVSYKDAGVDIGKWNETASKMGSIVKKSFNSSVLTELGSFGGVFSLKNLFGMKDPVLVSTIDGVGTKLKVAAMMNKWDTVGIDLVNHCSNDVLCMGAKPLFFLDYVAGENLDGNIVLDIVKGVSTACKELDCPLVGGETAEMPGTYLNGEYDIAGTMVGFAEKDELITGKNIAEGDCLVALASSGLHTNGYSLARKVLFDMAGYSVNDKIEGLHCTLGEALLAPHKSYSKAVLSLKSKPLIKGIAHITGGGIFDNISRILPEGKGAAIDTGAIKIPQLFRLIQEKGCVSEREMYWTLNMGVGLVLAVAEKDESDLVKELSSKGEKPFTIGKITSSGEVEIN